MQTLGGTTDEGELIVGVCEEHGVINDENQDLLVEIQE
jgi:hypothetical protein